MFTQRRISRSLVTFLFFSIFSTLSGIQAPSSFAAAGSIGPTTTSGTCASSVGETTYAATVFVSDGFCLLKVSTSTTWTVPTGVNNIDILVVGGGGGGGSDGGGGGGGGEVRTATGISTTAGASVSITVGLGGSGSIHGGAGANVGGTSSIVVNSTTYSAGGGAIPANWQPEAYYAPGGSGGTGGSQITGGANYSKGGRNSNQNAGYLTGFGTVGYDGPSTSFTGSTTYFAGGGGGGICTNTKSDPTFGGLAGGAGGGGRGSLHTQNVGSDHGQPGMNGLGGGGGGGSACNDGGINGVNARTNGGRGGDGVVYIKFVPIITFTSTPANQNVVLGSTTSITAVPTGTVSGPTRAKQWQVLVPGGSWTNISGATSDTYALGTVTRSVHGNQYRFVVTDTLGAMSSQTITAPITLTTYPPYQGETDTAFTGGVSRSIVSSDFSKIMPGTMSIYTLQAWVKPGDTCDSANLCTIFSNTQSVYLNVNVGKVAYIIGSGSAWCDAGAYTYPTNTFVKSGQWSHVSMVRNGVNVKIYINGALVFEKNHSCSPTTQTAPATTFGIGYTETYDRRFYGSIDDARIWSTDRSANLSSDMSSNETSTSGLMHYWNFNEGTGTKVYDQVPNRESAGDLTLSLAAAWDSDAVSTTTFDGAYTVETFYKNYISVLGGWKIPANLTKVSALVVGGGGGGGGAYTGDLTSGAGGGGGGGVFVSTTPLNLAGMNTVPVVIGPGGRGGVASSDRAGSSGSKGLSSYFGTLSAGGGGAGGYLNSTNQVGLSGTSGGGGGGSSNYYEAYTAGAGGSAQTTTFGGESYQGYGGGSGAVYVSGQSGTGDAGAGGGASTSAIRTAIGAGIASTFSGANVSYGRGGGARGVTSWSFTEVSPNLGTGGSGQYGTSAPGGHGSAGIVIVRWITKLKPTYSAPTIAYLNAGMTETFTTNVAQDSATVSLTRNFRWESSTSGVNGTYSLIKQGTGAANAAFSWVPSNTLTSGSTYAYRVIITDSDNLGLFIVDTSTPVWAIINPALVVTGSNTIAKAINVTRSETFTITLGTSTYRPTLSPAIPGITLDTSTAGIAILRIAETATVGTHYETLTVTDSVSAVVNTPLTITVAAPPSLINSGEIESDNLILHLDAGNSKSMLLGESVTATSVAWRDLSGNGKDALTTGTFESGGYAKACQAPVYSNYNGGYLEFDGTNDCYMSPYLGTQLDLNVTVEVWVRVDSALGAATIIQQNYTTTPGTPAPNVNYVLGDTSSNNTIKFGIYDGSGYQQVPTGITPTLGVWTHIVGTYDGSYFRIYKNGVIQETSTLYTAGLGNTLNNAGTLIGRRGSTGYFFDGGLGSVRIYKKALTGSQILQNYNATKDRFITAGAVTTRFTQKYGSSQSEAYTATSGYGSRNTTFALGDRLGVDWDTATANTPILNIQESLTVGTYWDTATVTDSLGQSTYLPIKMSISKADTITVTLSNPRVLTYTGSPAASLPTIGFTGLKNSDTGTVTIYFSAPASGAGAPESYAALVNSTTVPADVESYTVSTGSLSMSIGSLANYEGVIYETSTLRILQANQAPLRVALYGAIVGSPFAILVEGGSGGGAVVETVTAGSTATGCAVSAHALSMTSTTSSYCNLLVTKAATRNYKVETTTAQIYFMLFIISQPTQVGSGSGIGLSGSTPIYVDPNQAPTITSLSATSISLAAGGTFTITGAGFTTSPITVKFWRNKEITVTSSNGTALLIPVSAISSAGATTGRISVITPSGQAVSVETLTINP